MENRSRDKKRTYTIIFITINIVIALLLASIAFGISGTNIVSQVRQFIVDQVPPVIVVSVNMTPEVVYTNSTLNCTIVANDTTSDITANITWIVNETLRLTEINIGLINNVEYNNFTGLTEEYFIKGANVSCNVTVIDEAGNINTSSEIKNVRNYPPELLNLSYPEYNDELFTNRTPTFNWTNATDIDNDVITFELEIDTDNNFDNGVFIRISNITENKYFYNTTDLDFLTYYWRVRANDSENTSDWTDVWNFTLKTNPSIILVNDTGVNNTMDFGLMNLAEEADTEDSSPPPFKLENDGNIHVDVNISADRLWSSSQGVLNTSYFQYKANYSDKPLSFSWGNSQTDWGNMSDTPILYLLNFNYTRDIDRASVDIRVEVPLDEPTATLTANVLLTATEKIV